MTKFVLNKQQVSQLIFENKYPVGEEFQFLSRCFEGNYPKKENLPALAFPGGDLGELALIFSTANTYGFKVDREKTYQTLIKIISKEKFFHYHVSLDEKEFLNLQKNQIVDLTNHIISGCLHTTAFFKNPKTYNLEEEDLQFLKEKIQYLIKKNISPFGFRKETEEAAVLIIYGKNWSIYPQHFLKISLEGEEKLLPVSVFVFHQSLIDERHKLLSQKLIEEKAVELYPGCDKDYLYQVISAETENHLFESLKFKNEKLPVFKVEFKNEGSFVVDEMGNI